MCGATDLDAVYLVQGSVKYPKQRSWHPERIHICRDCHGRGETPADQWYVNHVRWTRVVGRGDLMPPTPCEHCGLHFIRNGDPLLKRMTCSASCLTSLSDSRNASRGNKGSNQPCEVCSEQITTGRADSRYCGSACRQKAYRQRQATQAALAAQPLRDARGRSYPKRSQRKALENGVATLAGLCAAFATAGAVNEPVRPSEVNQWRADLAEARRVVEALHVKLCTRSDVPTVPGETMAGPSRPATRKNLAQGTAALSGLCSGLATVEELTAEITPELAGQWQTETAGALAGIDHIMGILQTRL